MKQNIIKTIIFLSLFFVLPFNDFAQKDDDKYKLVFQDDFLGHTVDTTKWQVINGIPRDFSFISQKAYHKKENIFVKDGFLNIITKSDTLKNKYVPNNTYSDFMFSTGEIWTKEMFPICGKFEARIKLPKAQGLWSAFWLYSEVENTYNELDIFETNTNKGHLTSNMFYADSGGYDKTTSHYKRSYRKLNFMGYTWDYITSHFCTYTLVWNKKEIRFYIDGKEYRKEKAMKNGKLKSFYPQKPMHIIINTAVFSKDKEKPQTNTPLLDTMQVDYVRIYTEK